MTSRQQPTREEVDALFTGINRLLAASAADRRPAAPSSALTDGRRLNLRVEVFRDALLAAGAFVGGSLLFTSVIDSTEGLVASVAIVAWATIGIGFAASVASGLRYLSRRLLDARISRSLWDEVLLERAQSVKLDIERAGPYGGPLCVWPAEPSSDDPPFVGRDNDLDRLDSALRQCDWVVVTGDRGVGKTRLLQEYARRLNTRRTAFQCLPRRDSLFVSSQLDGIRHDTDLLILDDSHLLGWAEVEALLHRLGPSGPKVVMVASAADPPPLWLRFARRAIPLQLGPLDDDAILDLAGMSSAARGASHFVSVARGAPLLAMLAAQALKREDRLAAVLDRDGRPLGPVDLRFREVERSADRIGEMLLAELAGRDDLLDDPHGVELRRSVARWYLRWHYDAELSVTVDDDAVHVYAAQRIAAGSFLTVVSCRKSGSGPSVEIGLVHSLQGAMNAASTSVGGEATTAYHADGGSAPRHRQLKLAPQDVNAIRDMLKRMAAGIR